MAGTDALYRLFPKPDRTGLGRQSRWAAALTAANVTDEFLAQAVAAKLPARIKLEPKPEVADTVAGRLMMLTDVELKALGLTPLRRETLARQGCAKLPLEQAVRVAHALRGSLDWLAGSDRDPGEPCAVDARLDWKRYTAARKAAGVREQVVASALRVDIHRLRRMLRGSEQMTLGQARACAGELRASLDDLTV